MLNAHPPEPKATTADVAAHLRVSTRTVQNYRDQGKIPYVRINARTFRYSIQDVEVALRK